MNKKLNMARQLYSNFMSVAGTTSYKSKNIHGYDTGLDSVIVLSNCPNTEKLNGKDVKFLEKGELNVASTVGRNMRYSVLVRDENDYCTVISANDVPTVIDYLTSTFTNHYVRNGIDNDSFWIGVEMPQLTVEATSDGNVIDLFNNGKYNFKITPGTIDDKFGKALDSNYVSKFEQATGSEAIANATVPTWLKLDKTPDM